MNQTHKRWLIAGAAAGLALGLWVRQKQIQRRALACQIDNLTRQAIASLGTPAQSRFILAGDALLHTVVAGPEDGPLAILLHGFPECWYTWRKQIAPLAQAGYHVVVPDQRGYNLSARPPGVQSYNIGRLTADVLDLIHACGRERAVIIGHDWGGVVAWGFAMRYPAATDRLIVMNAPHPAVFCARSRPTPRNGSSPGIWPGFKCPGCPKLCWGLRRYLQPACSFSIPPSGLARSLRPICR